MTLSTARTAGEALIKIQDVIKTYKTPAGSVDVLKHINLEFLPGEFTAIVGKSGSGKSTLINMITGIDHPSHGSVHALGSNLHAMKEGELAVWRGRNMGVVFQFFQLLPMLSVIENVLLAMDLAEIIPPDRREERARQLLEMLDLQDEAEKLPGALSGGQQQTAAIARALANDPPIIAADEPTGNLDTGTAETIFAIFRSLVKQGKTIIMVTHDQQLAESADRQVVLSDGELLDTLLVRLFPHLPHPVLLQGSHMLSGEFVIPPNAKHAFDYELPGLLMVKSGSVRLITAEGQAGFEDRFTLNVGQALAPDDKLVGAVVQAGPNGAVIQTIGQAHWKEWHASHRTGFEKPAANLQETNAGMLFSENSSTERQS